MKRLESEIIDPTTLSVVHHRLQSINKEMGAVMVRTSKSPIFAEVHDFSCAICDDESNIVSQIEGVPSHMASTNLAVKEILEDFEGEIEDGDVYLINDPSRGGTHLPDVTVIKPIFYEGELKFFGVNRAHHQDVGGITAGGYTPAAKSIFHEGIRIPPLKIYENGEPIDDVLELVAINTRLPETLRSDINAQVASCNVAKKRIGEMIDNFGINTLDKAVKGIHSYSERIMRKKIEELPDGIYEGESFLDSDGQGNEQIAVRVEIQIDGDEMTVDFGGTDDETKGFVNSPFGNTLTCVYAGAVTVLGKDIPHAQGSFEPVEIIAPEGSLVNPSPEVPVADSTLDTACAILEAVWMALSDAAPERAPAGWNRWCGPVISGVDPRNGEYYVMYPFESVGGGGALPYMGGLSYMSDGIDLGGLTAPNIETEEVDYPHLTEFHEFRTDSGGAGKYRGGLGVKFRIKINAENPEMVMFGDGIENPPYGLRGGEEGAPNRPVLNEGISDKERELPSKGKVKAEEIITYTNYSAGGGGWGDPYERPPEKVREDVLNGYVSLESAKKDYGVAITENMELDWEKTKELRGKEK